MTKADFYSGLGSKRDWIGSLIHDGQIWNIPSDIFLQVNKTMFEEMVLDLLRKENGIIPDNGDTWPWLWADSRMTDYSYIFLPEYDKVYMSKCPSNILVDPISILQGKDMNESDACLGEPMFPIMKKELYIKTEELLLQYGYSPTQII